MIDDESEAKFLALKTLQMKKLKQLTAQLDAKDKDISKLKILNKVRLKISSSFFICHKFII